LGKNRVDRRRKGGFLKKRMSRDLAKDMKEKKDTGIMARRCYIHLLLVDTSETFIIVHFSLIPQCQCPLPFQPSRNSVFKNTNPILVVINYTSQSAPNHPSARTLRRVHSGTSLRGEEGSTTTPAAGLEVMSPLETEGKEVQKKKGPIDMMIVRGFDSSLAFAEGRMS
jgi:hypothetical protein